MNYYALLVTSEKNEHNSAETEEMMNLSLIFSKRYIPYKPFTVKWIGFLMTKTTQEMRVVLFKHYLNNPLQLLFNE